jgi:hypothetical protein
MARSKAISDKMETETPLYRSTAHDSGGGAAAADDDDGNCDDNDDAVSAHYQQQPMMTSYSDSQPFDTSQTSQSLSYPHEQPYYANHQSHQQKGQFLFPLPSSSSTTTPIATTQQLKTNHAMNHATSIVMMMMNVPTGAVGRIIGHGGANIQEIEQTTNTMVYYYCCYCYYDYYYCFCLFFFLVFLSCFFFSKLILKLSVEYGVLLKIFTCFTTNIYI